LYITSFESADLFFGQFEKLDADKLFEMQDSVNSLYGKAHNNTFIPKVGSLVCAKFTDGQFYRAVVENSKGTNFEVFFLDYGNHESVSLNDVHPMNKQFAQYPQFGVQCCLEKCPKNVSTDKLRDVMLENTLQFNMIREENKKWVVSVTSNYPDNAKLLELLQQQELVTPRAIHGMVLILLLLITVFY